VASPIFPWTTWSIDEADRKAILSNDLPCIDAAAAGRMREEIFAARDELDSIGGIVECGIYGLPAGIGDPMFDGIERGRWKVSALRPCAT